jgi:hypothetical protein
MGQVLHGCATTTEAIRRTIQNSQESLRALSKRYGINPKTVAKWKKRGSVTDLPTGPKEPKSTSLSLGDEAIIGREKRSKVEPEELSGNLIVQLGSVTEELNIPARWSARSNSGLSPRQGMDGGDAGRHPQPNDRYPIWAGPGCKEPQRFQLLLKEIPMVRGRQAWLTVQMALQSCAGKPSDLNTRPQAMLPPLSKA